MAAGQSRPSSAQATTPARQRTAGARGSHLNWDAMTKFTQLIVPTVASPARSKAVPVPFRRSGIAVAARKAVITPAAAAMNPSMTRKTRRSQRCNPGSADWIGSAVLPM